MQLWSDPTPSDATAANLASKSMVQAPGIGTLVSAILEDRYRKQQQQQQMIQNITSSLGKVTDQYKTDQGNSALAGFMENNDPNVNADIKTQLDGLPPEARLKALTYLQQQNAAQDKGAQQYIPGDTPDTYTDANGITFVRGANGWSAVSGSGRGLTAGQQLTEERYKQEQASKNLKQQVSDLTTIGGLEKGGIAQSQLENPDYVHKGIGPGGEYVPPGYYALGEGKEGFKTIVPSRQFDAAHSALDKYNELLNNDGAPSLPSKGNGPPVGTKGVIQGRPVEWDGYGWVAQPLG